MRTFLLRPKILLILGLFVLVTVVLFQFRSPAGNKFRLAEVTRGDVIVSVGATGTVEPEEVIDVGAQVAG